MTQRSDQQRPDEADGAALSWRGALLGVVLAAVLLVAHVLPHLLKA